MANQRVGIDIITSGNPAGAQQVQAALAGVQSAAGQAAAAVAQVGSSADPAAMSAAQSGLNGVAAGLQNVQQSAAPAAAGAADAGRAAGNSGQGFMALGQALQDAQYGFAGVANNLPQIITMFGGSAGLAGGVIIAAVAVQQLLGYLSKIKTPNFAEWAKEAQASGEVIRKAYSNLIDERLEEKGKEIEALGEQWEAVAEKARGYLQALQDIDRQQVAMEAAQEELKQAEAEAAGLPYTDDEKEQAALLRAREEEDRQLTNEEEKARLAQQQAEQDLANNAEIVVQSQAEQQAARQEVEQAQESLRKRGIQSDQERKIAEGRDLEAQRAKLESELRKINEVMDDPRSGAGFKEQLELQAEAKREEIGDIATRQQMVAPEVQAAREIQEAGKETWDNLPKGANEGQRAFAAQATAAMDQARKKEEAAAQWEADARQTMEAKAKDADAADAALNSVQGQRDVIDTRRTAEDLRRTTEQQARLEEEAAMAREEEYRAIYAPPEGGWDASGVSESVQRAGQETAQSASQIGAAVEQGFGEIKAGFTDLSAAVQRALALSQEAKALAQQAKDNADRMESSDKYNR